MSIAESIIQWMQEYSGGIDIADQINVDQLLAMNEGLGLFKSPGDEIHTYIGGARDVTANFLFMISQPSQTDVMRMENQQWLEGFERWVRSQNRARRLPELSNGRKCTWIDVSNSFAAQAQTESETIYQITITINYSEEG